MTLFEWFGLLDLAAVKPGTPLTSEAAELDSFFFFFL